MLVTFITPAGPSSSAESRPPLDRPCSGNIRARLSSAADREGDRTKAAGWLVMDVPLPRVGAGYCVASASVATLSGLIRAPSGALICALSRHSSRRPDRSGPRCRPRSTRTQVYERPHPPAVCDGRSWEPGVGSRGRSRGRGREREQRAGAGQRREETAGRGERRWQVEERGEGEGGKKSALNLMRVVRSAAKDVD